MTSFQFKLWRLFLKSQFSKSEDNKEIDLEKVRRFESPLPPKRVKKKCEISNEILLHRNVYTLRPKKAYNNDEIIIYFHGGGYITGITTPYWSFTSKLTNYLGRTIILADYPIAPEKNYRDTINFSVELYQKTVQKYNNSKIYLIGDSCGGGIALSISQKIQEIGLTQPDKIILLSPWLDLSLSNPDIIELQKNEIMIRPEKLKRTGEMYAGDLDVNDSLISPINADVTIFPEIHLFSGTHDVLSADSKKFIEIARKSGVVINYYEYDKMIHCWMIFPIPEANDVMNKIKDVIEN